jgi:hypothetical protein
MNHFDPMGFPETVVPSLDTFESAVGSTAEPSPAR